MSGLLRLTNALDLTVTTIGRIAAWLIVLLVGITVFDVITRRYFVLGSTMLQELEWHLHTALFALCLGYAYLRNAHVRIEILRERASWRTRAWIELLGCLVFLIPYCLIVLYYAVDFAHTSFMIGERSTSPAGLCCRWIIKSALPLGLFLLLLSGIAILLRQLVLLFGPEDLRARAQPEEWQ